METHYGGDPKPMSYTNLLLKHLVLRFYHIGEVHSFVNPASIPELAKSPLLTLCIQLNNYPNVMKLPHNNNKNKRNMKQIYVIVGALEELTSLDIK